MNTNHSQLRTLVATIDHEFSRLARHGRADDSPDPMNGLVASWVELVKRLELGS